MKAFGGRPSRRPSLEAVASLYYIFCWMTSNSSRVFSVNLHSLCPINLSNNSQELAWPEHNIITRSTLWTVSFIVSSPESRPLQKLWPELCEQQQPKSFPQNGMKMKSSARRSSSLIQLEILTEAFTGWLAGWHGLYYNNIKYNCLPAEGRRSRDGWSIFTPSNSC